MDYTAERVGKGWRL